MKRALSEEALSRRLPHYDCDVLVVGSGVAGLFAAITANEGSDSVILVTKDRLNESVTAHAQGGVAAVIDPADHMDGHVQDTVLAGAGLCDLAAVELLVEEGPKRIDDLIRWGMNFDRKGSELSLTREGGHRHARILHAHGDATGKGVSECLISKLKECNGVSAFEFTMVVALLHQAGRCYGAIAFNHKTRSYMRIYAKCVILASGGAGQVFRETTNPSLATGDGYALAHESGLKLKDMEFIQFHPTALYVAGAPRFLISEAVRGEGAILVDVQGNEFMRDVHELRDLAPRDIVARSIVEAMARTKAPCVYLDLSSIPEAKIRMRFPTILKICERFGIDICKDLIPVSPSAHYVMGGIETDLLAQTGMEGLLACGEVACTGVHGANRLASNSLLEGMVFGHRAGKQALGNIQKTANFGQFNAEIAQIGSFSEEFNIDDALDSIKALMWKSGGIVRSIEDLNLAQKRLDQWAQYIYKTSFDSKAGFELQNSLLTAQSIVSAARQRTISVGSHYIKDLTVSG